MFDLRMHRKRTWLSLSAWRAVMRNHCADSMSLL